MSMVRSFQFATIKTVGVLVLGSAILWQVGAHSGPPNGTAYVHVTTAPVDVTVDEKTYHVETLANSPVVCEVPPGKHVLRMTRHGLTLFQQKFSLKSEGEIVLVAWESPEDPWATPLSP
jgi:hypothetical protein